MNGPINNDGNDQWSENRLVNNCIPQAVKILFWFGKVKQEWLKEMSGMFGIKVWTFGQKSNAKKIKILTINYLIKIFTIDLKKIDKVVWFMTKLNCLAINIQDPETMQTLFSL